MLGGIFGMFGEGEAESRPPQISPDAEVGLIKRYLERKFNRKFKKRVKVDGYLDSPEYRLVLNDYDDCRPFDSHAIWGDTVKDVLGLSYGFVNAYWRNVEKAINAEKSKTPLDKFDEERMADYRNMAVASSREEMLLRAAAEGAL